MRITPQRRPIPARPVSLKNNVLAFIMALLLGCSRGVPIAIANQSGRVLQNVTVSGSGFNQRISSIPAGETATLRVHPKGETGVAIAFDSGGKKFSYPESGYVEASGYEVTITVNDAGRASVNVKLAHY
jgi:hypothetical protein